MDLSSILSSLQSSLGDLLPKVLAAISILVVGWIVAVIVRAVIRKSLAYFNINTRIKEKSGSDINLESGVASGVFYIIMLLVLVAFFSALDLQVVSEPLQDLTTQFFDYVPKLVAGGALLLVTWIIATLIKMVSTKALSATSLDEKITSEAGMRPVSQSLGNILYWLVFLIFLPAILSAFEMQGLLKPVESMVNKILDMLPNIFGAAIIGFVGWMVAKILRDLVSNLMSALGADHIGEKAGLSESLSLSRLTGVIVFVLIFVPVLISALNTLQIEAISGPATEMLAAVMKAIPNIFAAVAILAVSFFVARFISGILVTLLDGTGYNTLPEKLGFRNVDTNRKTPAEMTGKVILFFIMLFATVEAAGKLEFHQVSSIISTFIQFGGQVLLGVVILGIGLWLANLVRSALLAVSGDNASAIAGITHISILVLVAAMGLRAMGIADDIVNIAFSMMLGAIAVAIALSFGLGGREAAGLQMEYWLKKLRK